MADLSRSDVQHAVQDALHSVQNDVSRISHVLDSMNRVGNDVRELSRRLSNLERSVNQVQNTVSNTLGRGPGNPHPDPMISTMMNELHDLRTRFATIEKFALQMNDYMQTHFEDDKDDREYRTA